MLSKDYQNFFQKTFKNKKRINHAYRKKKMTILMNKVFKKLKKYRKLYKKK